MGKKFVLFLAAWIAALPLAGAENLLRDPAFSRAGKRDADWYFVRKPDETASAFKAADGVLRLEVKQPGGAIFSCQRIAPEPGKRYIASFEARGLPGADINAYAEWRGTDGRYRNRTFPKKPVLQRGWKKYEFAFSGDETMGTGKNRPIWPSVSATGGCWRSAILPCVRTPLSTNSRGEAATTRNSGPSDRRPASRPGAVMRVPACWS